MRIKGQANIGDGTVHIYYRMPHWEEEVEVVEGPSTDNRKQPQNHRHWFSWETSFTVICWKTTLPGTHSPRGSWAADHFWGKMIDA